MPTSRPIPDSVTRPGFEILFQTWDDTHVARIRAGWLTFGAGPHKDDCAV
ncbi:H-type lectin domain-containing protein [Paracoccus haematequi]|nr:H-type lectin domain-containing protein [Paracoccus haematequi]